ncbi:MULTISPECIES: TonB-dependent receptor [unclassified Sphingopyxis]|uniref:TonB-dependent receptor n=1 Tax=unclassified Sphingopyxis TaxID=2614943 RepID=UPI0009EC217B|nr:MULTISPECIES: TonB-dependent receptor [unclassified Sphingopyxis]
MTAFLSRTLLTASLLALATAAQAQTAPVPLPAPSVDDESGAAGDEIVVTGSALRSQEAVRNRRESLGVVDTLTQDDTGDLADETLAEALIRVPGVSSMQTLYGEQEAAYVSTRGISPDLNFVSFDGIALFSTANDGDGLRRVDLNLIPTQISRTTEVYKSFTADLDAGAIGGVTNIQPRSALHGKDTFYIDGLVSYQAGKGKYVPGDNSLGNYKDTPWGWGVKGLWAHKFGGDEQFGIVLSGMFRQKHYDYTKRNPNGRVFYTPQGNVGKTDLSDWDGLQPLPTLIRPMDYTHFTKTFGGSAQFEYRAAEGLEFSLLGYAYKQIEDQNLNQFYVEQFSNIVRTGPETSRLKIGRTRPSFDYDRFQNETRGGIFKTVKEFGEDASLEVRAGYSQNKFYNQDLGVIYSYSPPASYIEFDMSQPSDQIRIDNNEALLDVSKYALSAASDLTVRSKTTSREGRVDFKKNYAFDSSGLGFAVGVNARRVSVGRDQSTTTYVPGKSTLGSIGFVPDINSFLYNYPVLWIDYQKFAETVKPGLAINQATTGNAEWSADYRYKERILAAYASLMYATDNTRIIAGVRYDDVDFDARSPLSVAGKYDGSFQSHEGGYSHFLPSLTITHSLTDNLRIKAAYSRSLGRPAFDDIARAEVRNDENLTIARGNPDLKPRRSDNFDLAAEYYFGGSGLISLGGFYKNIKDDIYTTAQEQDIDGVTYTVSTPRNTSASKMRGIEFQIVTNSIPGLPLIGDDLGVSLNATRMWADMDYASGNNFVHLDALQYQADWLLNATMFYKLPNKGELRVAYNWKSKSPISLGAYPWTTYWLESRGQLDAALRYSLTDNVIVKLQANNILKEPIAQGYLEPYAMRRYEMTRNRSFSLDVIFKI